MHDRAQTETIAVFAGAAAGARPARRALAEALGAAVAARGARLLYGGGAGGLMAAAAAGARRRGGAVVGVYPACLVGRETVDPSIELIAVDALADRKAVMARLADAFVALPGGLGTLEEAVEMLSLARLGLFDRPKPIVFLDEDGYWDGFFGLLEHMIAEGFAPPELARLAARAATPEAALALCGVGGVGGVGAADALLEPV